MDREKFVKEIKILKKHIKSFKQTGIIGDLSEEGLLDYKGTMKNIDEFKDIILKEFQSLAGDVPK